ncbi:MAG: phosphotransferase, partial [Actinomycetota bacterium]
SDAFLGDVRVLTRDENSFVLRAVNEMYRGFRGEKPDGACSLEQYFDVFLSWGGLQAAGEEPIIKLFIRGWELFPDVAPPDVAEAMEAIHRDPSRLAKELSRRDSTFIHGDLRLHNLGLASDRVVLLDWELASYGPPAVDFAWYLIISATRIDASREEITDDFRKIAGDDFDPVALELAMTTALAQLGWNKALDIVENPDLGIREQERADLDWWIARVRRSLETWSPV